MFCPHLPLNLRKEVRLWKKNNEFIKQEKGVMTSVIMATSKMWNINYCIYILSIYILNWNLQKPFYFILLLLHVVILTNTRILWQNTKCYSEIQWLNFMQRCWHHLISGITIMSFKAVAVLQSNNTKIDTMF